ncbi:MAG: biopolymer transporter ExbD [Verrucomicrobia bacterium]|nr:biopolymer transporter ExbD [Verrucomicrobiota bacterium]
MRTKTPEEQEIGFQITPIVDIVALLIMFFMCTAATVKPEGQIGVTLPGSGEGGAVVEMEVYLGIQPDGAVTFNEAPIGQPMDDKLQPLRDKLQSLIKRFGDKFPVYIAPSPNSMHQRVIDVLDACAASGVKNLSFSEVAG